MIFNLSWLILNLSVPGMCFLTRSICCDCSGEQGETFCYHWLATSIQILSPWVSIWYRRVLHPVHSIL